MDRLIFTLALVLLAGVIYHGWGAGECQRHVGAVRGRSCCLS